MARAVRVGSGAAVPPPRRRWPATGRWRRAPGSASSSSGAGAGAVAPPAWPTAARAAPPPAAGAGTSAPEAAQAVLPPVLARERAGLLDACRRRPPAPRPPLVGRQHPRELFAARGARAGPALIEAPWPGRAQRPRAAGPGRARPRRRRGGSRARSCRGSRWRPPRRMDGAGQQLVEDHAQRENVAAPVERLARTCSGLM